MVPNKSEMVKIMLIGFSIYYKQSIFGGTHMYEHPIFVKRQINVRPVAWSSKLQADLYDLSIAFRSFI